MEMMQVVRKKYRMHDIPENYRMLVDNVLLESVTKSKLRGRVSGGRNTRMNDRIRE